MTTTTGTRTAARVPVVVKVYGRGDTEVRALDGVSVGFPAGRFTAIMGPSGSGKSTLMHCAAGLDTLGSGAAFIGGTELGTLDDRRLTQLRRDRIGFVFQAFNLVPTLTAAENITLPLDLAGRRGDPEWTDALLALAVLIALLGIANTLTLAIHERTRELGLLRAVGQTRAQTRAMVRWESVLVAAFGTAGGLALGAFLGRVLVRASDGASDSGFTFAVPPLSLLVVALVGLTAGALAGLRPGARAARLDVLRAIGAE